MRHDYWTCECDECLEAREDAVDRWIDGQQEREERYREAQDAKEMEDLRRDEE